MALDATVAGVSANSYLDVAAADTLAAADFGPEAAAWLSQDDVAIKEAALQRATRELDSYLRSGWGPYATTQALLFPRLIDVDSLGAFVPRNIRLATYEQATFVLANAKVLDQAATRRARDLQSASEPNTSWTIGATPDSSLSPSALAYLTGYRTSNSQRGIRSIRMASGYAR